MAVGGAQVALRSRAAAPEALSPQQRVIAQSRAPVVSPKPFTAARAPPPRAAAGTRTEADASLQASTSAAAQVVLTREQGKNGKLRKVLEKLGVSCLEMPLVETAAGPDRQQLAELLRQEAQQFDWVCVTSPEAAKVFVEAWRQAGTPAVRIAVVGDGTGRVLVEAEGEALKPQFLPSVANAEHFAPELPLLEGGTGRVLYPSSSKASTELQAGLTSRGFDVTRLNTYDTLAVQSIDQTVLEQARQASVLTVASPSAIKAWIQLAGREADGSPSIACIGSTSARAAEKLGLTRIYYPQEPGVENWAESIMQALADAGKAAHR